MNKLPLDQITMNITHKDNLRRKKPDQKKYKLYMTPLIIFWYKIFLFFFNKKYILKLHNMIS